MTAYDDALAQAIDPDHAEALRGFMSSISETQQAAGWLNGLEVDLWTALHYPGGTDYFTLTQWESEKLQRLSDKAGGWWHWPKDSDSALFIPLAAWLAVYEEATPI